jgi:hypothetical protein
MAEKTTVFAFGRMNPPTTGHEKLVNKIKDVAKQHNADHLIVMSHSQDAKKNPLSAEQKLKHAKRFFPKTNLQTSSKEKPTYFAHAADLNKSGTQHLIMVAGSDRVDEFHKNLHKYNGEGEGKLYNFKSIKVVSAGERDPDAEGVEGMSASKMREHAKSNNFDEFKKGVPSHVSEKHAKELFHDVRKGMNISESFAEWVSNDVLHEIAYSGNIGIMELIKFRKMASPEQKALLNKHVQSKKKKEAWDLVQKVTKVKLHPSVSEENKYRTASGSYKKNIRNKSGLSKKYSGNLSHSTQLARKAHWKKTSKMDDNNPAAYTPAPGDKGAKTKESIYTKRYKERFGEEAMKIPYLLMNNEQKKILQEQNESSSQITYLNTKTQNFDMCPKAYDAFKELIGKQSDVEMKMMQTTKKLHATVSAGIQAKPEHIRKMQFKQYLGL